MFLDALAPGQRSLLPRLGRLPLIARFYLAGGSAVALHCRHRKSLDFDFYTAEGFDPEELVRGLLTLGEVQVDRSAADTFLGSVAGLRCSAFLYPYKLLEETAPCEGVRVARPLDLAAMKVVAIGQRGRRRDFVDLHALVHTCGPDLGRVLRKTPEKFGEVRTSLPHFLRALVYFADAETDPPVELPHGPDWPAIRRWYEEEVPRIGKDLLDPGSGSAVPVDG